MILEEGNATKASTAKQKPSSGNAPALKSPTFPKRKDQSNQSKTPGTQLSETAKNKDLSAEKTKTNNNEGLSISPEGQQIKPNAQAAQTSTEEIDRQAKNLANFFNGQVLEIQDDS